VSQAVHLDFEASGGLLPAIAQDAQTGQVLMLAWMNREALDETLATGRAVYYSRSRKRLWRKGEESGHVQSVVEVHIDCDADAILLRVQQQGAACHEGFASCFFRKLNADGSTTTTLTRLVDPAVAYGSSEAKR
jgi:phosphoribosyl-AMP cyclohydrolase